MSCCEFRLLSVRAQPCLSCEIRTECYSIIRVCSYSYCTVYQDGLLVSLLQASVVLFCEPSCLFFCFLFLSARTRVPVPPIITWQFCFYVLYMDRVRDRAGIYCCRMGYLCNLPPHTLGTSPPALFLFLCVCPTGLPFSLLSARTLSVTTM